MGLEDLARRRILAWLAANPRITQVKLAAAVGVSQTWVSQYKSGDQGADLDQLEAMARAFDHTIFELLDLRPDPKERDLIEAFRRLRKEARPLAIQLVEAMSPPSGGRGRPRGRSDE